MKWLLFLLALFLFISALVITSNGNLHLSNPRELSTFYAQFYGWLGQLFVQGKDITGAVVRLPWLPHSTPATGVAKMNVSSDSNSFADAP